MSELALSNVCPQRVDSLGRERNSNVHTGAALVCVKLPLIPPVILFSRRDESAADDSGDEGCGEDA